MLLDVKNLEVGFDTYRGRVKAVRGVSFDVAEGEIVGIVGESGCGKSVTVHALMGLLPEDNTHIKAQNITFAEKNILAMEKEELRQLRGGDIAMIFQDPMTSLNPVLSIGYQLRECIRLHESRNMTDEMVNERAVQLLSQVGIKDPEKRMTEYHHQFSGGMRQRAMIAMALAGSPKLLIADEPTTALDVTIQNQIMELLKRLKNEMGMSIILISHDLGLVASNCERVNVMYAGEIVEAGYSEDIFNMPKHPYTQGLLKALPRLSDSRQDRLVIIDGQPPNLLFDIPGCGFAPRCQYAMKVCKDNKPDISVPSKTTHSTACWLRWREQLAEAIASGGVVSE